MNSENIDTIVNIIMGVLEAMGFENPTVQPEETITKGLVFNINLKEDSYLLIGHRGNHLHALDILLQAIVAKTFSGQFVRFSLDVDDYKRKREWYIKETVRGAVEQIKRTGRAVGLMPMPNYERKIVHALIQAQHPEVVSTSMGVEPRRRVVIRLK